MSELMNVVDRYRDHWYQAGYDAGYERGKKDAVAHGHWIRGDVDEACSVCKITTDRNLDGDYQDYPFCPYCGACMDAREGAEG